MVCFPLHPPQCLACTKYSFIFVWCSNIKLKKRHVCACRCVFWLIQTLLSWEDSENGKEENLKDVLLTSANGVVSELGLTL